MNKDNKKVIMFAIKKMTVQEYRECPRNNIQDDTQFIEEIEKESTLIGFCDLLEEPKLYV